MTITKRFARGAGLPRLYPAHRIDWNFNCAVAALGTLLRVDPDDPTQEVLKAWGKSDAAVFLSVRSAFVALLEAVNWPVGTEIIVTGVNIGDVPGIIRSFGHIVVPVDIEPLTLSCNPEELDAAITDSTRAIIVAHLFGGRMNIEPVLKVARRHGVLVVEDCAQRYATRASLEPRVSDVRLFSFGLLKTGTALGGAVAEVGDSRLRKRMEQVQSRWQPQTRRAYAGKVMKSLLFIGVQQPLGYRIFSRACAMAGSSSGEVVRRLTRGFGKLEGKALLDAFRRRPSGPLLRMLAWRLKREDGKRVIRRARAGERMFHRLKEAGLADTVVIGAAQSDRTHWLVPVSTRDPDAVRRELAAEGFDAYGASNVVAIGGQQATRMIEGLVFLPCYPEMSGRTRDRLAAVVRRCVTAEPGCRLADSNAPPDGLRRRIPNS